MQSPPVQPDRAASPRNSTLFLWVPVLLYCMVIFTLSSVSTLPSLPGGVGDKIAHALMYGGLGFLLARGLAGGVAGRVSPLTLPLAILLTVLYGVSDEFHQLFVPGRHFDLRDVAADGAGGAAGAFGLWLCGIIMRFRHALK